MWVVRTTTKCGGAVIVTLTPKIQTEPPTVSRLRCSTLASVLPVQGAFALGVCTERNMAELAVGQRVKVRPRVGPVQEGVVYTHDALTNTITIKQDIPNTKTHTTLLVFNRAHVEIDVVPGAIVADESLALPNIRYGSGSMHQRTKL